MNNSINSVETKTAYLYGMGLEFKPEPSSSPRNADNFSKSLNKSVSKFSFINAVTQLSEMVQEIGHNVIEALLKSDSEPLIKRRIEAGLGAQQSFKPNPTIAWLHRNDIGGPRDNDPMLTYAIDPNQTALDGDNDEANNDNNVTYKGPNPSSSFKR